QPLRPPSTSSRSPYTTLFRSSILLGDFVLAVTSLSVLTDRMNSCLNGFFLLRNAGNYLDNLEAFLPASFHNVPGQNQKITSYSQDRKSTRLNSSHVSISYAVF